MRARVPLGLCGETGQNTHRIAPGRKEGAGAFLQLPARGMGGHSQTTARPVGRVDSHLRCENFFVPSRQMLLLQNRRGFWARGACDPAGAPTASSPRNDAGFCLLQIVELSFACGFKESGCFLKKAIPPRPPSQPPPRYVPGTSVPVSKVESPSPVPQLASSLHLHPP